MKVLSRVFMVITLSIGALSAKAGSLPEYKDHKIVGVNRLPSRASFWYYTSWEDALNTSYLNTPENVSLNGEWSFSFAEKPADRKADFYASNYDVSSWDKITVPGSWPLQGYDKAIYLNHPYEFNTNNPFPIAVPDDWNPVGSYRRDFDLPNKWDGERIVLHFGAVKSSFYVWVNGQMVGYSQDSKMQAEFDITPYVRFGQTNSISVEVYRFSVGSYLEGQDMWRLAGIKRDVWIYATPREYIADFSALTTLRDNYTTGVIDLQVELGGGKSRSSKVDVELLSSAGKVVYSERLRASKDGVCETEVLVPNAELWSDEEPNLYTLILKYGDRYVASKVGFRSVELKDSQMLVNGKAVRIKGVNRHEHHPKFGHYIPVETMQRDIELMKLFNVNAIRTAHYPDDPYLYELADKYGVYICDEANVETHGLGAALQAYYNPKRHIADNPEWESLFHDRIFRMVERDKNHPSVIMWSMGNECGDGVIFRNGYAELKRVDPSRLVLFEQAGMQSHTDIVGPMYATMDKIENYALATDTYRPMILAEYCHAMGNSLGNFDDYWALFDAYPNLQGGFIWDWVDQGVEDYRDGERFFDYGGAFGLSNMRNDGAFCLNGIVNPDREPNPHAYQMRKSYDDVDVQRVIGEPNLFEINNKFRFTNLSEYALKWRLLRDGEVLESGEMNMECAPERKGDIRVPFGSQLDGNYDYHINFDIVQRRAKGYLPQGHVVASEQISLKTKKRGAYTPVKSGVLELKRADDIRIAGSNFEYVIDADGRLSSVKVDGREFLESATQYDFHRVPVDNDGWNKDAKHWKDAHKRTTIKELTSELSADGTRVKVVATSYVDANEKSRLHADFTTVYTIYADGAIQVDNSFIPTSYHAEKGIHIPRLGERFALVSDFEQVQWYGRGPWENYADRKSSAFVGRYSMSADELMHNYINPQENGYRTDVRSIALRAQDGKRLSVVCHTPLCFSASHYPKEVYYDAQGKKVRNTVDLRPTEELYLNVDYGQMGVGGDNSWGNPVHTQYQILLRAYNYGYIIMPSVD